MQENTHDLPLDYYPEAIIAHSFDGQVLAFNKKAKDLFSFLSSEIADKNIYQNISPTLKPDDALEKLEIGSFITQTMRIDANGKNVIFELMTFKSRDKDGNTLINRVFSQTQAENSKNWMHNVLGHMRSGVCVSDPNLPDNPIIFVNKAFEKMTGYTAQEVVGKNCRFLQGEKTSQPGLDTLRKALKEKKACSVVLENFKKDGSPFANQLDISVVYDKDGHATHFVGQQYDITERLQQQVELAKQKEIAVTASKMAALGEMAGNISHEINNPLMILRTHIDSLSDYLEKGHKDFSEAKNLLSKMDETINRIAKIVKSLKEFSHKTGVKEMNRESLEELIHETLTFCQERLKSETIDLELDLDKNAFSTINRIEISQILINLINNAIDECASLQNKKIRIESRIVGNHCTISISDYGKGVQEADKDVIFNPFFTTKVIGKGTGLGLSISKKIMASHGGTLEITSLKDPTTFTLKLKKS